MPKAAHDKQLAALKEKFDRVLLEYVACPREAFSGPRSDYSARPGGRASLNPNRPKCSVILECPGLSARTRGLPAPEPQESACLRRYEDLVPDADKSSSSDARFQNREVQLVILCVNQVSE